MTEEGGKKNLGGFPFFSHFRCNFFYFCVCMCVCVCVCVCVCTHSRMHDMEQGTDELMKKCVHADEVPTNVSRQLPRL